MEEKYYFIRLIDGDDKFCYVTINKNRIENMTKFFANRFKLSDLECLSVKNFLFGYNYVLEDATNPGGGFHSKYIDKPYNIYHR